MDFFNFPMWAVEKTAKAMPAPLPTLAELQESQAEPDFTATEGFMPIAPKRPGRPKGSKNKDAK